MLAFLGVTEKNGENIEDGVADLLALMPSWCFWDAVCWH